MSTGETERLSIDESPPHSTVSYRHRRGNRLSTAALTEMVTGVALAGVVTGSLTDTEQFVIFEPHLERRRTAGLDRARQAFLVPRHVPHCRYRKGYIDRGTQRQVQLQPLLVPRHVPHCRYRKGYIDRGTQTQVQLQPLLVPRHVPHCRFRVVARHLKGLTHLSIRFELT